MAEPVTRAKKALPPAKKAAAKKAPVKKAPVKKAPVKAEAPEKKAAAPARKRVAVARTPAREIAVALVAPAASRPTSEPLLPVTGEGVAHQAARSLRTRAAIGVGLLVGYYVLAIAVIVAVIGVDVVVYDLGRIDFRLILITIVVVAAVLVSVFKPTKFPALAELGIPVTAEQQPELWRMVTDVAQEAGTGAPSHIVLCDDVNAAVLERSQLLGLLNGQRILLLGMGLLTALDRSQLRAVLAHEMGHHVGGDTRLGPISARASVSIATAGEILDGNIFALPFQAYGKMFRRVSLSVRRAQETSADLLAARVAGSGVMIDALREVHAAGNAFALYQARWLRAAWSAGVMPTEPTAGFRTLLDHPRWSADLVRFRTEDGRPTDPFDSHPSLSQRVASLAQKPIEGSAERDHRPAVDVLVDPRAADRQVAAWVAGRVLRTGPATLVEWADVATHLVGQRQRGVHRAVGTVVEAGAPMAYAQLLAHCREKQDSDLLEAAEFVAEWQLVEAGKASWTVDFGSFVRAVDGTGAPVVLPALDQATAPKALTALGIDLQLEVHDGESDEGPGPLVIFPNVGTRPLGKKLGRVSEVLIYREVFVVAFRPGSARNFLRALGASLGRRKILVKTSQARLAELANVEPEQALALDPRNYVTAWADVSKATVKAGTGGGVMWQVKLVVNGNKRRMASQFYGTTLASVTAVLRSTLGDRLNRP